MLEYPGQDVWVIMAHGRTREAGLVAEVAERCPGRKRGSDGGEATACGHAIFHCDSGCVTEHWEMSWKCWTCDQWQRGGGPGWMGCVDCGEKRPPGVEMVWRRAGWVESEYQGSELGEGDYVVLESSDDGEGSEEEEEKEKREEKGTREMISDISE